MSQHIRQIQTMLKDKGFYAGSVDGIAGPQTVNAVRQALGIQDTPQAEVQVTPTTATPNVLQLSDNGLELIKEFEGFRSAPYRDAVGVPTIGYGNTYYMDGSKVRMTDRPLSRAEAHDLKLKIVNKDFAPAVRNAIAGSRVPVTQNMFDAMVSLAYNIGVGGFAKSSVVRHLRAGNKQAAADAFLLWNKAGGRVLAGLERRRRKERALFLA